MKSKEDITMAFQINDGCVMCGACAGACPVGAISEGDASTKSTLLHVSHVEHVQELAQQVLSLRSNRSNDYI